MQPPTRTLPAEIIEEIFLRLPPNEPACLVRASLASKLWLVLLSGPSFHGRYCEFHGAPPMLGFVYYRPKLYTRDREPADEGFVSTTRFGARITDGDMRHWDYDARDCRHGRVLLGHGGRGSSDSPRKLVIWNPMTGSRKEFQAPVSPTYQTYGYGAAVLCAVTGCDHRACHEGPVRVVLLTVLQDMNDGGVVASAHVFLQHESSSHFDELSQPCSSLNLPEDANIDRMHSVLIKDALYFMISYDYDDDDDGYHEDYGYIYEVRRVAILKYDLVCNCLSLFDGPPAKTYIDGSVILVAMEDGSLGFAQVNMLTLHLWSRKTGCDGVAPWTACRVIDLEEFLPIQNPKKRLMLLGSMERRDIIFVTTDLGIYEICLKTLRWKKIWKSRTFLTLIPYTSFYNPRERVSPSAMKTHG